MFGAVLYLYPTSRGGLFPGLEKKTNRVVSLGDPCLSITASLRIPPPALPTLTLTSDDPIARLEEFCAQTSCTFSTRTQSFTNGVLVTLSLRSENAFPLAVMTLFVRETDPAEILRTVAARMLYAMNLAPTDEAPDETAEAGVSILSRGLELLESVLHPEVPPPS